MKILIVSTLKRKIAPDYFASRSRIIYQLTQGLVSRGHKVSVLGTGDSVVSGADIIPVVEKGWNDLPSVENQFLQETALLIKQAKKIIEVQNSFDIIHNHTYPDFFPLILENELTTPMVTTLHALYDSYMDDLLSSLNKTYFIALSKRYASLYKKTRFFKVVYNGVDTDFYKYSDKKKNYLFWLGRMPKGKDSQGNFLDPKGVRWAIKLAQETGVNLFLSAPVEDPEFYEKDVAPYLNDKIKWVGEVSAEQTAPVEKILELFQGAKAFLMTVNQHEPFGLVMTEAGSCGTPVIGFNRGSVSEVVVDGVTGYIVDQSHKERGTRRNGNSKFVIQKTGIEGLKEAFSKIDQIDPRDCRKHVVENFSVEKMVENYEKVYREIIGDR